MKRTLADAAHCPAIRLTIFHFAHHHAGLTVQVGRAGIDKVRWSPVSESSMQLTKRNLPRAARAGRLQLARTRLRILIISMLMSLVPVAASANCNITDTGIPQHAVVAIDPSGARQALALYGMGFGGTYIGEVLGNPLGGLKQGTHFDGLLDVYMNADFERMAGWKGLCFHANGYQIHGTSITAQDLGSIVRASNIEAFPSTRLDEFWFEQKLLNDLISVRFGALAVDTEFLIAHSAGAFIDSTFGWPTISSVNLPFGGPNYPFASPGVRVSVEPNDHFKLMIDVSDDNPIGPCPNNLDPGQCNTNGLEFRLNDPPLLLVEADYAYDKNRGLPGTIKLGGWKDFGKFDGQRFDGALQGTTGANPLLDDSSYAIYGVINQTIYRLPDQSNGKGISVFARVVGSPSDRNPINAYADGGIVFTGMIARRPNDVFGIGVAYTGISDDASTFERDDGLSVIGNHEVLLEMSYTAELRPGWTLQPDLQYIWNPGGNVPDDSGSRAVENAMVVGARTTMNF
jgi:porin